MKISVHFFVEAVLKHPCKRMAENLRLPAMGQPLPIFSQGEIGLNDLLSHLVQILENLISTQGKICVSEDNIDTTQGSFVFHVIQTLMKYEANDGTNPMKSFIWTETNNIGRFMYSDKPFHVTLTDATYRKVTIWTSICPHTGHMDTESFLNNPWQVLRDLIESNGCTTVSGNSYSHSHDTFVANLITSLLQRMQTVDGTIQLQLIGWSGADNTGSFKFLNNRFSVVPGESEEIEATIQHLGEELPTPWSPSNSEEF